MVTKLFTHVRRAVVEVRARIDGLPLVGRVAEEWRRVEVVDRAMVTAAQGLLALVPLVIVLVAYLPPDLTRAGLERFADITGLAAASVERAVTDAPQPLAAAEDVRERIGLVGAVVTVLSASSFARSVMRSYEKVWDLPHLAGFRGRRRALGWLLGWLFALEVLSIVLRGLDRAAVPLPVVVGVQVALTALLWWWSLYVLLHGARTWRALAVPAVVSAGAIVAFTRASVLVMPEYSLSSARQFGGLGLVLALATWLVMFSGVLVLSAILGRTGGDVLERRVGRSSAADGHGLQPTRAASARPESSPMASSSSNGLRRRTTRWRGAVASLTSKVCGATGRAVAAFDLLGTASSFGGDYGPEGDGRLDTDPLSERLSDRQNAPTRRDL